MRPLISDKPEAHHQVRGYRFYPSAVELSAIPTLHTQRHRGEAAIVYVRYFSGWGEWCVTELDPHSGDAFGWVCIEGFDAQWGGFNLVALESQPGTLVERDVNFAPAPARDVLPASRSTPADTEG
ncbi:hypothetical protein CTZ27_33135 [Streptomyces griseocarneus]|nr:hypothetical protein CTZ27_33135 [Streptomyces griseocarneus]